MGWRRRTSKAAGRPALTVVAAALTVAWLAVVIAGCGRVPPAGHPDLAAPTSSLPVSSVSEPATTQPPTTQPPTTQPPTIQTVPPTTQPVVSSTTTAAAPTTTTTAGDPAGRETVCGTVPARRPLDPSRPRYAVTAAADPQAATIGGWERITFVPDLPIDRLVLRLWANAPRLWSRGGRAAVADLSVDGRPVVAAPSEDDPTVLVVPLGRPVPAGASLVVQLRYAVTVADATNDRVSRDGDSLRLGSFVPLLAWEPGIGWATEPPTGGFAEATTSPAADWDLTVTVPPGYGVLAEGVPADGGRWTAVGARDLALSVGRFRTVTAYAAAPEPVTVTVGVDAALTEDPVEYAQRVVSALVDFAQRFGDYPWPTFTLALTGGLRGGIEYPGFVMQGPGTIGRTTPHEVAHQWFYGLVGNDQARDPVLDEGLASYAELTHEGSFPAAAQWAIPPDVAGRAGAPMTFWEDHLDNYYLGVYVQGAQSLYGLGPPELVDCALSRFVAANAWRLATPADLLAALTPTFPGAAAVLEGFGIR